MIDERTVWAQAADVIRERGWHQGSFVDYGDYECGDVSWLASQAYRSNPVCVVGALAVVLTGDPTGHSVQVHQHWDRLSEHLNVNNAGPHWNDLSTTTVDDVLRVLAELDELDRRRESRSEVVT